MRKSHLIALKTAIASSFLIVLVYWAGLRLNWSDLIQSWAGISALSVLAVCACILVSHLLRVVRIYLAYAQQFEVNFTTVTGVSLSHNTLSFLLPMRLGEAALPLLSKNQLNIDLKYSTASLLLVRVFDAHVLLLLLMSFASASYFESHTHWILWSILLLLPAALAVFVVWLKKKAKFNSIRALVDKPSTLIMLYLITVSIWVVKLGALAVLCQLLGELAFSHAWIAMILADASALSPITGFANAGTFEAAFILPLLPLGYNSDALLNVALNIHILILLTNLLAGGLGVLLLLFKRSTK